MPPIWTRISGPVSAFIYVYYYGWTVNTHMAVIESMVIPAPVTVPMAVMAVIMIVPVIMVPIVIVIVVGSPGAPVPGIVIPVPG